MEDTLITKRLMGGVIEFMLNDLDETLAKDITDDLFDLGLRLEKIFNVFDPVSELSLLNKDREMKVSDELLYVLNLALKYSRLTDGLYDISKGKNFLERKSNKPLTDLNCSYKDIEIKNNTVILKDPDVLIDLGSIAKGYIVDKLVELAKDLGVESGYINARGDLRVFGEIDQEVSIEHPRKKETIICSVNINDSSIATSGDYNQYYGTYENSHIITKNDLISVSVGAKELVDADAIATCIFVLDKENRERFIKLFPDIKVFCIDNKMNQTEYNGFKNIKLSMEVKNV